MRWGIIIVIAIAIITSAIFLSKNRPQTSTNQPSSSSTTTTIMTKTYSIAPVLTINPKSTYTAQVLTSAGPLTIELFAADTPQTANNFVFLAREKFYDGTIFHRIIQNFMIQGGDPKGNGTGGPGYSFADEPITKNYTRGTVAMANSGPNTNGSQFFIMTQDTPLPKNYVIFGQLVGDESLATLDKIASTPVTLSASGEHSQPTQKVTITSVTITEK